MTYTMQTFALVYDQPGLHLWFEIETAPLTIV